MKTRDFIYFKKTIMKTIMKGSNFKLLKRAGGILMLLAVLLTSCDKYGDDFDDLNAKIDALTSVVSGIPTLSTDIASLKTQVTGLQTAIASVATSEELSALSDDLATANSNIEAINTALGDLAGTYATTQDATDLQASVDALQASIDAQKTALADILLNTALYQGNVVITTDADVAFFMNKLSQLSYINGNLTINPALITNYTDLKTVTSKIMAIVGTNSVGGVGTGSVITCSADAAKMLDFSNLEYVSGDLSVVGAALITQSSIDISKLKTVSGNLVYSLDGPIDLPSLTAVGGNFTITPYTTTGTTITGTTSVDLPLLTVTGTVMPTVMALPSATSVVMPANGLTAITAALATNIEVVNTEKAAATFTITPKAGSTVKASFTEALGALTVGSAPTFYSETIDLSKLAKTVGALTLTTTATGSVNLDMLADADVVVTIAGAKEVSLPVWTGGTAANLIAVNAETISMPVNDWTWTTAPTAAQWPAVKKLTDNAINAPVDLTIYTNLEEVYLTGKTVTTYPLLKATVTSNASNTKLKSITLDGMWYSASITDAATAVISTLSTSGVINAFTLANATKLDGNLTLGHEGFIIDVAGVPGAEINVMGCTNITSLTATNLNMVYKMDISGNSKMTTMSFPKLADLAKQTVSGASFTVKNNAFTGAYTASIAGPPYFDAKINSPELFKLKPYLLKATNATTGYTAGVALSLTYDYKLDGTTLATLGADMTADAAGSVLGDDTATGGAIDVTAELGLIYQ